ncbi:hypothetical protein [Alkalilimnicola sp. S0819]|uniref:hypothetical protein n=1 Tax=Alkalilimnicola sp. S0819 TaxID=2613922 RepID=UPI0018698BE9|nr:hypothetical protein [Alkalilimnicola sp. S0819]
MTAASREKVGADGESLQMAEESINTESRKSADPNLAPYSGKYGLVRIAVQQR